MVAVGCGVGGDEGGEKGAIEGTTEVGIDEEALEGDADGAGTDGCSLVIINGEFVGLEIANTLGGAVSVPSTDGDTVRSKNSCH
jgi:hypothetical protein